LKHIRNAHANYVTGLKHRLPVGETLDQQSVWWRNRALERQLLEA